MLDPRLTREPFNDPNEPPVHIVFRHSARAALSYQNALFQAERQGRRLYMVFAQDSIAGNFDIARRQALKDELLLKMNFTTTGYRPSCLLIYVGMRVLLQKMYCHKLGLTKWAECVVEHIQFSDKENIGRHAKSANPIVLSHMPDEILLRAIDASWELPFQRSAAGRMDMRGVFQVRCDSVYFNFLPSANCQRGLDQTTQKLRVRRVQFAIVPSDRVVHSAQGSELRAVVLDMARPPKMNPQLHWLACLVMLSRAVPLDGLLITRLATLEDLNYGPPDALAKEIARLHEVEVASFVRLSEEVREVSKTRAVPDVVRALFERELSKPIGHPSLSHGRTRSLTTTDRPSWWGSTPRWDYVLLLFKHIRVVFCRGRCKCLIIHS